MAVTESNLALQHAIRDLAEARARYESTTQYIKEREASFRASIAIELEQSDVDAEAMQVAERNVKALAEAIFRDTGDAHPGPGVTIKLFTKLRYSAADAFAWAKSTHMALTPESLDVKAFEKIAKATTLPFVITESDPRVTIATDLEKWLAEKAA